LLSRIGITEKKCGMIALGATSKSLAVLDICNMLVEISMSLYFSHALVSLSNSDATPQR
jgi:hypothetical protein